MRLQSFRIRCYKSVVDSGLCRLSDKDNILVLAGQNESGKSSVLQALRDYERGKLGPNVQRSFGGDVQYPIIECTYAVEEGDDLFTMVQEEVPSVPAGLKKVLAKEKAVTLIRTFTSEKDSTLSLNAELMEKVEAIEPIEKEVPKDQPTAPTTPTASAQPSAETDVSEDDVVEEEAITAKEVADSIWHLTPKIIFFDDFCDLLPERILISELKDKAGTAKGYRAVKNIETILDTDLTKLDDLDDARSSSAQYDHNKTITANFNERWRQKIFDDNIVQIAIQYHQGREAEGSYLNFFILTKEGEYLTPEHRSQGLKWFLSFYLQLTAESKKSDELVILFDEPGLFLHAKAQKDIKDLFGELAEKDQIIYSTHSPYLIDTEKLGRVRLVLNSRENGTQIEKITTKKVANQKDALQPIIDAMGLEIAHGFTPVKGRNVIVEGISDFHYLTAMKKVLEVKTEFAFVPSMGAPNVHLLMELCTGWGLEWLIILDDGRASKDAHKSITDSFFDGKKDEADEKIYIIEGADGIEDAFTASDLQLVESEAKFPSTKKKSDVVKEHGGKELYARKFLEKVDGGEITKAKLGATTIKKFENIFAFIEKQFTGVPRRKVEAAVERALKSTPDHRTAQAAK